MKHWFGITLKKLKVKLFNYPFIVSIKLFVNKDDIIRRLPDNLRP
jgi:hypothetical protein